ncbi:hypothetical protein BAY59_24385 [Prauserella coralliicola]|nr:hypothetical protein BAY59_24385 [Prauserella coralliicola]
MAFSDILALTIAIVAAVVASVAVGRLRRTGKDGKEARRKYLALLVATDALDPATSKKLLAEADRLFGLKFDPARGAPTLSFADLDAAERALDGETSLLCLGTIPTLVNDLADADAVKAAPFRVEVDRRCGAPTVAVLSVDEWAESAEFDAAGVRRAIELFTEAEQHLIGAAKVSDFDAHAERALNLVRHAEMDRLAADLSRDDEEIRDLAREIDAFELLSPERRLEVRDRVVALKGHIAGIALSIGRLQGAFDSGFDRMDKALAAAASTVTEGGDR